MARININEAGGQLTDIKTRRYHLKDVIVGKIYFLLVRIKIKTMELSIIRRETTGACKFELTYLELM